MKKTNYPIASNKNRCLILISSFALVIFGSAIFSCSGPIQEEEFKPDLNLYRAKSKDPQSVVPLMSVRYDITGYMSNLFNGTLTVSLIYKTKAKGTENEQLVLFKEGVNDCIYYDNCGVMIQIWWDRTVTGILKLLINGEEFILEPSFQSSTWKFTAGEEAGLNSYTELLQKIASIASDFDRAFFQTEQSPANKKASIANNLTLKDLKQSAISKSEDPSCNGPEMQSGVYYAWTGAECCSMANADVNAQCNNSYCTGCCTLNCNWTGLLGEYMGYCSSTGTSCSE